MSDPIQRQDPNAPQVLSQKDYGYGVSTQDTFQKPQYQEVQPTQTQQTQQPVQAQATQFRTPTSGSNDSVSRLVNFTRANMGAGTQRMQQGIQSGLQNQTKQYQNQVRNLGASDLNKGLAIAQNQGALLNSLNSQAGYKNLIGASLGTSSPVRAGIENFMLKSTPGAMSNIQNTQKQGFQNTLNDVNQYLVGGFKTNVVQNGNVVDSQNKYGALSDKDLNVQETKSEEDIARDMNLVKGPDGQWYHPEDLENQYVSVDEQDQQPKQATGLINTLNKNVSSANALSQAANFGTDYLNKKTGIDVNGLTNVGQPGQLAKTIQNTPGKVGAALNNSVSKAIGLNLQNMAGQRASDAVNKAASLVSSSRNAASSAANSVGGFLKRFCHAAGTLIAMENGTYKLIEDIEIGDNVLWGGEVTAIGCKLVSDTYKYNETIVSGSHAVYEDNAWIRVKDSKKSIYLGEAFEVYPMITANHIIITSDGTVWRDYEELDNSENLTDEQILDIINKEL